jgi:phage terminase large subunit-like protein
MIAGGPLAPYFDLFESEVVRKDGPGRIRRIAANYGTADGLRPTAAIFDEVHEFGSPQTIRTHLVVSNGLVKRANGLELNISTAGAGLDSLLGAMFETARTPSPDVLFRWYAASEKHDLEGDAGLRAALREANPAIGAGFLSEDRLVARFREIPRHEGRRYYLNQWAGRPDRALPESVWAACAEPLREVADGAQIVLALDASFRRDATALVGATVEERPHLFTLKVWEQPEGDEAWRVPVGEVIATITNAARLFTVREIVYDPTFGWTGLVADLEGNGLDAIVVEWQTSSAARIGPAWLRFRDAILDRGLSHDGDPTLARHMENLVLRSDRFGERPTRDRSRPRSFIDAGIAATIAFDRASTLRDQPRKEPLVAWT